MIKNGVLRTILLMITLLHSCELDQVESKYADFNSASNDGLFEKGWIPSDLVFKSMTDIYQRTNLDLNTYIFSYTLSETDVEVAKQKLLSSKNKFESPQRVKLPPGWSKKIKTLDQYIYVTTDRDSVYIAIDDQVDKIFGWRNK